MARPTITKVEVKCANCGKPVFKYPSETKRRTMFFCDHKTCYAQWAKKHLTKG